MPSPAPATPPPAPLTAQVIHLEDDPEWASLVGHWVRKRGLTFHAVRSQSQLKEYLARGPQSLRCLIVDKSLEDGDDGLAVCALLKASPALQAVPVIMLTGEELSPDEALRRGALHVVRKDAHAEKMFDAVLGSVLAQHERSRGVIDAADIRLDPDNRSVLLKKVASVRLAAGPFAAIRLLVLASPKPVPDETLYAAFLERPPYYKPDHELSARTTLRNYVSRLRLDLGPRVGDRIIRLDGGYAYVPQKPLPHL